MTGGALNISPVAFMCRASCENDQALALTAQSDLPLKSGNFAGSPYRRKSGIYLATSTSGAGI